MSWSLWGPSGLSLDTPSDRTLVVPQEKAFQLLSVFMSIRLFPAALLPQGWHGL